MKLDLVDKYLRESNREYVYRLLKYNIINLNLPPGCGISEQEISEQIKVSRTPVREAFIKLSQEDLLDIIPQKGSYISLIDTQHVEESKFLRETLEKRIIDIACSDFVPESLVQLDLSLQFQEACIKEHNYIKFFELDQKMHGTIFAGCHKSRIWTIIEQMDSHYNRVRMLNLAFGYDWERLLNQHKDLVKAIRDKDVALGRYITDVHLNKVSFDLALLRKDFKHYFTNAVK